jgi:hypothetical protein
LYQTRPGPRADAGGGGGVDDDAAAAPPQRRDAVPGREIEALHIDREDAVELLLGDVEHRLVALGRAGVVDHYVEPAIGAFGLGDHGRDIVAVGDVGMQIGGGAAGPGDGVGDRAAGVVVDVGDDDARPFRGEAAGDRLAEAGGGTGHDRYLVLKSHRSPPFGRGSMSPLPARSLLRKSITIETGEGAPADAGGRERAGLSGGSARRAA